MAHNQWIYGVITILTFTVFCSIKSIESDLSYRILPKKVICTHSKLYVEETKCEYEILNRTDQLISKDHKKIPIKISVSINMHPNVSLNSFFMKFSVFIKDKSQLRYHTYIGLSNVTLDICKFLNDRAGHMLLHMMSDGMENYGNFMEPCPFQGHKYVKDYIPNESQILQVASYGDYLVDMLFYTKVKQKDVILAEMKILTEISPKRSN